MAAYHKSNDVDTSRKPGRHAILEGVGGLGSQNTAYCIPKSENPNNPVLMQTIIEIQQKKGTSMLDRLSVGIQWYTAWNRTEWNR
jgi:hypothetical protein